MHYSITYIKFFELSFLISITVLEFWEYVNKYDVWDAESGSQVFFLKEESGCLMRCCFANARALEISFQDMDGQELLRFERPLKCMGCPCDMCYPNCTQVCLN